MKTAVCWRRVLTIAALTPDDIKMRPLRGVNIPDVLHTDLSPLAGRRVRRRTNWDDREAQLLRPDHAQRPHS